MVVILVACDTGAKLLFLKKPSAKEGLGVECTGNDGVATPPPKVKSAPALEVPPKLKPLLTLLAPKLNPLLLLLLTVVFPAVLSSPLFDSKLPMLKPTPPLLLPTPTLPLLILALLALPATTKKGLVIFGVGDVLRDGREVFST